MIDFSSGARAGEQAALQFVTAPIVRAAILASLPVAREQARLWAEHGDEWQRGAAAYWIEFFGAFEEAAR